MSALPRALYPGLHDVLCARLHDLCFSCIIRIRAHRAYLYEHIYCKNDTHLRRCWPRCLQTVSGRQHRYTSPKKRTGHLVMGNGYKKLCGFSDPEEIRCFVKAYSRTTYNIPSHFPQHCVHVKGVPRGYLIWALNRNSWNEQCVWKSTPGDPQNITSHEGHMMNRCLATYVRSLETRTQVVPTANGFNIGYHLKRTDTGYPKTYFQTKTALSSCARCCWYSTYYIVPVCNTAMTPHVQ